MSAEKRIEERFDLGLSARVAVVDAPDHEREVFEFITEDISSGGTFIKTDQPLAVDTEVEIDLVLPLEQLKKIQAQGGRVHIKVTGSVTRVTSQGMGIIFDEDYEIKSLDESEN